MLALGLSIATPVLAQDAHNHGHADTTAAAATDPVAKAFEDANLKMHKDMAIAYSGDADVDFVRSMIPHHQGAIDMARIQLMHGKDPGMRALAEEVIKAQEAEIAEMRKWLQDRGM
jgi:uncharacterized protein (DUF305 family)